MTDLDLQKALITEIEGLCHRQCLQKYEDESIDDFHIYKQDMPLKNDIDDEMMENYIIVMLGDEDMEGDGKWKVMVHMIVGIRYFDTENQGNIIIANILNQLYLHFAKKGLINGLYEMMVEAHKRFNHDCEATFFEADLITYWKLPEIMREDLGALI